MFDREFYRFFSIRSVPVDFQWSAVLMFVALVAGNASIESEASQPQRLPDALNDGDGLFRITLY
ncbi:MAG: hypothetical protein ACREQV_22215 [Candidatus Binatia bacterium]